MKKTVLLLCACFMVFPMVGVVQPVEIRSSETKSLEWVGSDNEFAIRLNGINFIEIQDITQEGRVVTESIFKMIEDATAEVIPESNSFVLKIQGADFDSGLSEIGIYLTDGSKLTIQVPALPVSIDTAIKVGDVKVLNIDDELDMRRAIKATRATSCGGFIDSGNPYPCCLNGSAPDGNCTWYAWYRAHQTYHGWGIALPSWGSPSKWIAGAKKDSRLKVGTLPKKYSEGYSIGVNSNHVAWVYDYDNRYIWADEQNCCPNGGTTSCTYAGTRLRQKYIRDSSHFPNYIYKK